MKKLPHTISTEELLSAMKGVSKVEEISVQSSDPVLSFIQAFKLESGQYYIQAKLLYKLFQQWNPKYKMNHRVFSLKINNYLEYEGNNTSKYFKLNISPIKLGEKIESFLDKIGHTPTKSKNYKRRFETFLEAHDLKEGHLYVEADILYYLYDTWVFRSPLQIRRISFHTFTDLCALYFSTKYLCNSTLAWYGVTQNIQDYLKKEEVENWRLGRIKYGKKNIHKKNYIPTIGQEGRVIYKDTIYRGKTKKA